MSQTNLIKEKLFPKQLPRSRVQLHIVNEIKKRLKTGNNNLSKNIITYKKITREDGEYYIYRNGPEYLISLKEYIKKENLKASEMIKYFIEIFEILNDIPNIKEVFNGVIKLENLYLSKKEKLFIMEDNYLELLQKYAEAGEVDFKREYFTPPEVISRDSWTEKSYVFNSAAIFYYLFTGKTIFTDQDPAVVLEKIQFEDIIDIKYLNPDIGEKLNDLFSQMLNKNPDMRPDITNVIFQLNRIKLSLEIDYEIDYNNIKPLKKKIKVKRSKENIKLFFRRNWKLLLFFVLIGAGLIFGISGGQNSIINKKLLPAEVAKYFYKGLSEKNIQLIEETSTVDIGEMERLIVESHVVEKMQSAFEGPSEDSNVRMVYSLENLRLKEIPTKENEVIFEANYVFKFYKDDDYYETAMDDRIYIEQVNDRWKIVMIAGSLADMTAGNYPWEE